MSVLAAIAVLAILVVVHELGHFTAARAQGIYANRFSIGFGPILWKYQGSQTEYALRAFPLGGFVGFPDDDPDSTIPPDDPNLLKNRPVLDRVIVISAGVIANLIFAYLVLVLEAGTVGVQAPSQPGIVIDGFFKVSQVSPQAAQAGIKVGDGLFVGGDRGKFDVAYNPTSNTVELFSLTDSPTPVQIIGRKDEAGKPKPVTLTLTPQPGAGDKRETGVQLTPTPAIKAGIEPGDVVLALDNQELGRSLRNSQIFQTTIRENAGKPIQFKVQRGDKILPITVTPAANADNEGTIGVGLSPNGTIARQRVGGLAVFTAGAEQFQAIVNDTIAGFGQLISRFSKVANQVAGPVEIVAVGAKIIQADAASLFQYVALISINLAIINILPLPALDGGHLAFLLIEGLRGKPLPSRFQDGVMQTGLVLLLSLGIFLIIRGTASLIFPQ